MKHRIYVVGMGPGQENMMTQEAMQVLEASDVIIGYTVYLKLLGERFGCKELLSTPMRQERERCQMCFEKAREGKKVLLIDDKYLDSVSDIREMFKDEKFANELVNKNQFILHYFTLFFNK